MVLIVAIVGTYYVYPEYIQIVTPIYIAISLYYSTPDNINYLTSQWPTVGTFLITNKMYIIYALIAIAGYIAYQNNQQNNLSQPQPQPRIKHPEYQFSSDSSSF